MVTIVQTSGPTAPGEQDAGEVLVFTVDWAQLFMPDMSLLEIVVREAIANFADARQAFVANNIPAGYFGEPQDIGHLVALLLHRLRDISRGQSFRWMGACIISRTDVQAMH